MKLITSTTATTVIPHLDRIFSIFGLPESLKSDDGPLFNGHDFAQFARSLGFKHRRITPLWPKADGEAERFMRTGSKMVKTSVTERGEWKRNLSTMLRNYRATPHSTTEKTPAELMFGRPIKTKLPQLDALPSNDAVRERDRRQKGKMKKYADERPKATPLRLKLGDQVLAQRRQTNKEMSRYDPRPYVITNIRGTRVTARRNGYWITRNVSHFLRLPRTAIPAILPNNTPDVSNATDDSDTDIDHIDEPATTQLQTPALPAANRPVIALPQPIRRYPARVRHPPPHFV